MLREMRVEGAAFAAALDADSEHEEGKFYVWTAAEVEEVLGEGAPLFKAHYDVHWIGNWEGKTILNRSDKPRLMDGETEAQLAAARQELWAVRERRVRPGRDHKVLADWNGLAISALVLASGAFAQPKWLETAKAAFAFITMRMTRQDGRLFHSWCDGRRHPGTLDDYAAMARAALALYQATGEPAYLSRAENWVELLAIHYEDKERGGYFFTPDDASDLITRIRAAFDNAAPSGNGMMLEVLASLYYLTGKSAYRDQAERQIGAFAGQALHNAVPLASFLSGMDYFLNGVHIVICAGAGTEMLLRAVEDCCVPNRILSVLVDGQQCPEGHPAHGKQAIDNQATAFVCLNQTCSLPITDPKILRGILSGQPVHRANGVGSH
jgi:uncharacterized protein YyaL (SSP411 family)